MTDNWQPIETAPKDGTEFLGRGRNWGDENRGWHRHVTKWLEDRWVNADDEDLTLTYLVEWKPLASSPINPEEEKTSG